MNLQMFKLVLEQAEEPETKLPTSGGSSKKQASSRKSSLYKQSEADLSLYLLKKVCLKVHVTLTSLQFFPLNL